MQAFRAPHFRLSQDPRSTRFRIFDKIQPALRIPVSILSLFYFLFFFYYYYFFSSLELKIVKLFKQKKKKQKQSGICRIRWSIDRFDSKIRKRIVEGERKLRREKERETRTKRIRWREISLIRDSSRVSLWLIVADISFNETKREKKNDVWFNKQRYKTTSAGTVNNWER